MSEVAFAAVRPVQPTGWRASLLRTVLVGVAVLSALAAGSARADSDSVTVFAAASLTDALRAAAREVPELAASTIRFSFASSSTLARQIEHGAPAHVFASASPAWMRYLQERGLVERDSVRPLLGNRLVLVASAAALGQRPAGLAQLGALAPGERVAVGDPAHVPAGVYAREALESLGLWQALAPRLARADNVRAALALVERGEAPLGIVYRSDVGLARRVRVVAQFPAASHAAIVYPFALVKQAPARARTVLTFLGGAGAMAVYARFGFIPAG